MPQSKTEDGININVHFVKSVFFFFHADNGI